MNQGLKKLKQMWDDKPAETIVVLSTAVFAAAKIIDAVSSARGRQAYYTQTQIAKARAGL